MEKAADHNRIRVGLSLIFVLLVILGVAAWAITGQRDTFEAPTVFFSITTLVLVFGFF